MIELNQQNYSNATGFFHKGINVNINSSAIFDVLGPVLSEMGQLDDTIAPIGAPYYVMPETISKKRTSISFLTHY